MFNKIEVLFDKTSGMAMQTKLHVEVQLQTLKIGEAAAHCSRAMIRSGIQAVFAPPLAPLGAAGWGSFWKIN